MLSVLVRAMIDVSAMPDGILFRAVITFETQLNKRNSRSLLQYKMDGGNKSLSAPKKVGRRRRAC